MHNTSISPADYELLFGMSGGKDNSNVRKLNLCSLFANCCLHYHKVNETNLDWIEFTTNFKVNYKLRIENQISGFYDAASRLFLLLNGSTLISKGICGFLKMEKGKTIVVCTIKKQSSTVSRVINSHGSVIL